MPSLRQSGNAALLGILAPILVQTLATAMLAGNAAAQTTPQQTIGRIDAATTTERIQVAGAVTLNGSSTLLGNGSTITAGQKTLPIHLTRGGELDLCSTTTLHLSQQNNPTDPDSPLMLALDRGAIEAHYHVGKNSDVVLTPDLRILLSGPGDADVSIRVNAQGDTCVDNRGKDAPYLLVSEQMGTGAYRVQANQHVMFEHGSVRDVVDQETQPCGCPVTPVVSVASSGVASDPSGKQAAKPGEVVAAKSADEETIPVGGPSSTPADTAFPLAESEGLAAPPAAPTKPVVPPGEVHSEVTSVLSYVAPTQTVPMGTPSGIATPESAATVATEPLPGIGHATSTPTPDIGEALAGEPQTKPAQQRKGIFHKIGRFFARIFGN